MSTADPLHDDAALHRLIASTFADPELHDDMVAHVRETLEHLRECAALARSGGVEVSAAGLHEVLGYLQFLEERLRMISAPAGAA